MFQVSTPEYSYSFCLRFRASWEKVSSKCQDPSNSHVLFPDQLSLHLLAQLRAEGHWESLAPKLTIVSKHTARSHPSRPLISHSHLEWLFFFWHGLLIRVSELVSFPSPASAVCSLHVYSVAQSFHQETPPELTGQALWSELRGSPTLCSWKEKSSALRVPPGSSWAFGKPMDQPQPGSLSPRMSTNSNIQAEDVVHAPWVTCYHP